MNKEKQYQGHGFIAPQITPDNYVLGATNALPFEVIQNNGNWLEFLPEGEWQARPNIETYSCTAFGTLNAIEILLKRLYNE